MSNKTITKSDINATAKLRQEIDDAWALIRQYRASLPALQKDADRYRWLRDYKNDWTAAGVVVNYYGNFTYLSGALLDEAVDKALKGGSK